MEITGVICQTKKDVLFQPLFIWSFPILVENLQKLSSHSKNLSAFLSQSPAILMYRIFRKENKTVVKIIHVLMQSFALICGGIALKAVFRYHNNAGIPNMYTLHSWIGLPTYIMFGLQVSIIKEPKILLLTSDTIFFQQPDELKFK